MLFVVCGFLFKNHFFSEIFFRNTSVSNSLDQDQTRRFVRPDLGPNCLKTLSEDGIRRYFLNILHISPQSWKKVDTRAAQI